MFTICSLYLPYMVIICSIYVHYMSTDLSEKHQKTNVSLGMVHGISLKLIFTICALYVHYMFPIWSPYVQYMFTICPQTWVKNSRKLMQVYVWYMAIHRNWYRVFGRFSQVFKTSFLVQTLISQPTINQIKPFMDQNLSLLIVNWKQL